MFFFLFFFFFPFSLFQASSTMAFSHSQTSGPDVFSFAFLRGSIERYAAPAVLYCTERAVHVLALSCTYIMLHLSFFREHCIFLRRPCLTCGHGSRLKAFSFVPICTRGRQSNLDWSDDPHSRASERKTSAGSQWSEYWCIGGHSCKSFGPPLLTRTGEHTVQRTGDKWVVNKSIRHRIHV